MRMKKTEVEESVSCTEQIGVKPYCGQYSTIKRGVECVLYRHRPSVEGKIRMGASIPCQTCVLLHGSQMQRLSNPREF